MMRNKPEKKYEEKNIPSRLDRVVDTCGHPLSRYNCTTAFPVKTGPPSPQTHHTR